MRILILGCGGIGGFLAVKLAEGGCEVTVAARGDNAAAIAKNGIALRLPQGGERRCHPPLLADDSPKFPLILACVKMFDLEKALGDVAGFLAADGLVIPLQNGADAHKSVARVVGKARAGWGTAHISASLEAPGLVTHHGELAGFFLSPHPLSAALVKRMADHRGIKLRERKDIERLIWDKFVFLSAFSGATALFRLPMGTIRAAAPLWDFYQETMREAHLVALAEVPGVLGDECLGKWLEASKKMPRAYRASMALDLERGRRLELPWLSGRVVELGRKHEIATPSNELITAALGEFV